MSKKSNIRISRYDASNLPKESSCADGSLPWESCIQPEDGAWVLITTNNGAPPLLFLRAGEVTLPDGTIEAAYAPAEEATKLPAA